ncbi:CACTA en-spm transposon protein [Cucumis melo var. makuwa]|uniref:CACTA en-spm transposon protein n=1 Tax=Cucumis melo var. makuwa TaxID=1194695 RepID=A0A5D3C8V9_CUCMM|nr:CACTA en-spm transposon protein [Cucumis melo var. makuwa]
MFLKFGDDLDNLAGGSSSVGNNSGSSTQPLTILTSRRRVQSRLLKLERYVAVNWCIPMTIAPEAEMSISSHIVFFSQAIGIFVLDFNDQAMNRFVEHQMFSDCHRHFKKYSDPEEASLLQKDF